MAETETKEKAQEETQEEKAELLVELYSEEIPWKLQEPMARNLEKFLQEELAKALGLKNVEDVFGERRVYWTPRRVAVGMFDVPVRSGAWEEERKGPRVGSPQIAINGFLQANGLSPEQCQQKEGYLTFVVKHAALSTSDLLGEVVVRVIERMSKALPVAMRFGAQTFRWVRPLRHIMAVFAGEEVKGELELGHEEKLTFTNETRGHPFAAPDAFSVASIQDYEDKLRKNDVEPSYQKRFDTILEEIEGKPTYDYQKAQPKNARLMQENACLTEWPIVLKGHFDDEFMDLPYFLINTVLSEHQKMIRDMNVDRGEREFFLITNTPHIKKEQEKNNIIKGFERVVRARLADAKFMLERDQQTPIEELIDKLHNITFHPKLGTIADKNQRTKKMLPILFKEIKKHSNLFVNEKYDSTWFERQVDILNFDLATETVREFPSLQKLIGQGLTGNKLDPMLSPAHILVDLADNIDTLASLWSVGEKPTGSGDPFALRRCAMNVVYNLTEHRFFEKPSLPLKNILKSVLDILPIKNSNSYSIFFPPHEIMSREIVAFMLERLRVFIKDHKQLPHNCIEAVLAHEEAQECNTYSLYHHTIELAEEIRNNNPLAEIFYRLHAIMRSAPIYPSSLASPPSPDLFSVAEEKNLHARAHQPLADEAWKNLTFQEKLKTLGSLKDAVDPFFDHVLVMHENEKIRENRLRLLYSIYKRFLELADFTKIHHKDKQQKDKQRKQPQQ